jgi:hypothetical protein
MWRITRMRKNLQSVELTKAKAGSEGKDDPSEMLTALQDIVLIIGDANTETYHGVKLIAEGAIASAQRP